MPDLYRREPRNVGVVLLDQGRGCARFFGQDAASGTLNGRLASQLVPETRAYEAWVHYFMHHAANGSWQKVMDSLSRRQTFDNFYVEEGGTYECDFDDPYAVLEELFQSLVGESTPTPKQPLPRDLKSLVKQVFKAAHIEDKVKNKPTFPVDVSGPRSHAQTTIQFDYLYANGAMTIMERVPLSMDRRQSNVETVNEILYRIDHVLDQHDVDRFVALYHVPNSAPEEAREFLEPQLKLLEAYSDVLDVGDVPEAANNLRQRLSMKR
ncbi:hypothetical protein [Streptosporangium sp. NBC_01756]|uniref:hypothetical protein n=1 Tax=Streptosporangium sp. NBC_01756 TaxID=2975950 RepID=UPI002DDBBEE3|nr:hypothetical protein [Streptosporangium sp. NBC_01756]WSC89462.1 hypothetical protein OIE48_15145 [Streptosporangium sp. NBC_01756]